MASKLPPLPREKRPGAKVTRDLFLAWRFPRLGVANPHDLTNPVWQWLARSRLNAWQANHHFDGPSSLEVGPCWCAERFGQSTTTLPDGRTVSIGGEHEDYYDPDFCIYNDVHVTSPDGELRVYGYPTHVFPPTDFHSATLVGDEVFTIGTLGYARDRQPSVTPVFALELEDFSFRQVPTTGRAPGWLFGHSATLAKNPRVITVTGGQRVLDDGTLAESFDDWSLDLAKLKWARALARPWQEWVLEPRDAGHPSRLWEVSSLRWHAEGRTPYDRAQLKQWKDKHGALPDFALYDARFSSPVPHTTLPERDSDASPVHRVSIDEVTVRFEESSGRVRVVVEGKLPERLVARMLADAVKKLAVLEGTKYRSRRVQ
jgi:hypothetical protein